MKQTKDYSLLRPFDLEAAKAGEIVQWYQDNSTLEYIGPSTSLGEAGCFKWLSGEDTTGTYEGYKAEQLRMAPLAWVEGKPVYKGDILYWNKKSSYPGAVFTVGSKIIYGTLISGKTVMPDGTVYPDDNESGMLAINLTWNKPKVKKSGWMNCYEHNGNCVYPTKTRADLYALPSRTTCIEIFWEE